MIAFLRKHWVSLGLLFLSGTIGLVQLFQQTPIDIWRIEYEFKTTNQSTVPEFVLKDTVFEFKGIVCRNYTGSISDTLNDPTIRRHELKIYLEHPSTRKQVADFRDEVLKSEQIKGLNVRFRETQRTKKILLYWILIGFFAGMVVEFIGRLKKQPRPPDKG